MSIENGNARVIARGVRRGPYCRRSPQTKRAIIEQCLAPGASVAAIALAHGVNANLVRKWIHKHRVGEQDGDATTVPKLLPVQVQEAAHHTLRPVTSAPKGHIDIELAAGRVRVYGTVDVEMLRAVLASLR